MTPPTTRRLPRIGYDRLVVVALLTAALAPMVLVGAVAGEQLTRGLQADVDERVGRAIAVVDALLEQEMRDLDERARSYADWPVLASLARAGDHDTIRRDVLEFLVGRGTVDGAVAVIDGEVLAAGMEVGAVLNETGNDPTPAVRVRFTPDGAAFQAAVHRLSVPVSPARPNAPADRIILARRIDARFAADARRLTGFEVAVRGPSGSVLVATDATLAARVGSFSDEGQRTAAAGGIAVGELPLSAGGAAAIIVVAESAALQVAAGQLPGILIVGLVLTALLAPIVALGLARVLRSRLRSVHDGMLAIADGRLPPSRAEPPQDEVARLGAGLDRLVAALDRREAILERSLDVVASLSAAAPLDVIVGEATAGAIEVFGLTTCRLEEHRPERDGTDAETIRAALVLGDATGLALVGRRAAPESWTEADRAQFEVFALLVGNVMRDARLYAGAAEVASRLDRINRMQRLFLRSVSHNLHTPLTTIGLAAEDLAEAGRLDDFGRARLSAIQIARKRLERQVEELLTMSRIDAGTLELEPEALRLGRLVRRVWDELGLEREFAVVDRAGDAFAVADVRALEQVVWILLDNASRYAPDGPIRVVIEAPDDGARPDRVTLAVEDEGPGVEPEDRSRIFRRFARGSASAGHDGTGLGLAIARSLVREMDGAIRYRARPAGGASFVVTLPAERPAGRAGVRSGGRSRDEAVEVGTVGR